MLNLSHCHRMPIANTQVKDMFRDFFCKRCGSGTLTGSRCVSSVRRSMSALFEYSETTDPFQLTHLVWDRRQPSVSSLIKKLKWIESYCRTSNKSRSNCLSTIMMGMHRLGQLKIKNWLSIKMEIFLNISFKILETLVEKHFPPLTSCFPLHMHCKTLGRCEPFITSSKKLIGFATISLDWLMEHLVWQLTKR